VNVINGARASPSLHVNAVMNTARTPPVDGHRPLRHDGRAVFSNFEQGDPVRAEFLGKDPESTEGASPALFATDRTDRVTYIAQGWKVTDPQVLADVGPVPDHETLIEIPEEVLKYYARRYAQEKGTDN
jgi:hypothetical protein